MKAITHSYSYKSSSTEFIGDIPSRWNVMQLKYAAKINTESLPEVTDNNLAIHYIDISNVDEVNGIGNIQDIRFADAPSRARRIVRAGDTIISTVRTYLKAVAFFEFAPDNLIVSTGFAVLHPTNRIFNKYLSWVVQSNEFIDRVVAHSVGVGYPAINPSELASLHVWLPPLGEQLTITSFLDTETARIDALIAKYQRLIELLQEKRISVISQAVTRGLNPDVPLKDSGVIWLGMIPATWHLYPLKRIASIRYGLGQPPKEMREGVPLIRATNIDSGLITPKGMMYIDPDDVPSGRGAILRKNEIIIVRSGAYTGDSAIITDEYEGSVAGYDLVLSIKKGHPEYYGWQMLAPHIRDMQFKFSKLRAAQPHLNAEELQETLVMVPPEQEQGEIADYIYKIDMEISLLLQKTKAIITRLAEYRASLISNAITGKINVENRQCNTKT